MPSSPSLPLVSCRFSAESRSSATTWATIDASRCLVRANLERWRDLDENCPYRQWRVAAQTAIVMPVSDGTSNESIEGRYVPAPLECVECHTVSDTTAWRWRSYRIDDPSEDE